VKGEGRILVKDDEEDLRLVAELLKIDPAKVVVVSSGYSDDPILSRYEK